ncbi:MAG: caspase family protein [Planctomycetota bacterium]
MTGRKLSEIHLGSVALGCLIGLLGFFAPSRGAAAEPAGPPRLALLVGVERYEKLGQKRQLNGCSNDVRLMKSLLIDRFEFEEDDVVTLLNDEATGASIRSELRGLVQRANALPGNGPPAQVVFYFSGHGSQVPDQEEGHPDCDEEDGLDETLVPYDAEEEGGDQDIRDDELYAFVDRVATGGAARLFVVLDCCHSGTGVRGITKIRRLDRRVTPAARKVGESRKIAPKRLPAEAVLLSACRASEVEPEYQEDGESYGLLTRFLAQVLQESTEVSTLSYRAVRERIIDRYLRDAVVPAPSPQLEGTPESLRSVVLGAGGRSDRKPYWRVEPLGADRRSVRLAGGAFHRLSVGSLYELYERSEQIVWRPDRTSGDEEETSLAWLEVERVEGVTATARAFEWRDLRNGEKVEIGLPRTFTRGFAVERYHQHADSAARIRVVRAIDREADGPPLGPNDPAVPAAVREALGSIKAEGESDWLVWVEGDAPCDLLLRLDGHYAALFPAVGMAVTSEPRFAVRGRAAPASLRGGWGPIDLADSEAATRQLQDYLRRIVRARNLIRLAAGRATGDLEQDAAQIEVDLLAVKLNSDMEIDQARPWPTDAERSLVLRQDDLFALRVRHRKNATKPMYVTVLAVDPDMEIQALPLQGEGLGSDDDRKLEPGETRISSPYQCTEPYGPHFAIVLATDQPNDLDMLAQPALERTRSASGGSPLEALLIEQTYFRTRGSRRPRPQQSADPTWSATILRWDAVP